jgi:hypothetical protein
MPGIRVFILLNINLMQKEIKSYYISLFTVNIVFKKIYIVFILRKGLIYTVKAYKKAKFLKIANFFIPM